MVHKIASLSVLCMLIITCCAQTSDLEKLIKDIFNTEPLPTPSSQNPWIIGTTPSTTPSPPPQSITKAAPNTPCGLRQECVKRINCNNGQVNTDGSGLINIRIDAVSRAEVDCGYLRVCCKLPEITTEPIIDILPPEPHVGCGYQNPDGVGYHITVNDNEAQFAEFPWMAAILKKNGDSTILYECGGAVIAPTVILTASHCVQTRTASSLVVRAGEWDTQTKDEILPNQDRRVREIIVHEKYNKGALHNDIALLILETPLVWEENVRPICLPDSHMNFDGSRCIATGWGKDKFGKEGTYQVFLKKIDLPIMPNGQCQTNLRTTRLGEHYNLHDSFICAGGEKDKDTCKGDGGSPLVCPIPGVRNRYYQAGIVAWGIGCGEENIPGVYGNVPYLRQWVNEKLTARGIDFQHFTA